MCRNLFFVLLLLHLPSALFAQDERETHAAMRKSLAYIEVSGQQSNGVPLHSSGTGVLLDEIGHVLTVLHLITDVEAKALDNQFEVTVRIGDRNGPPRPATVIRRDKDRDVLVLRIQTATRPYQAACFGEERPPLPRIGELFLTSGFPLDLGYFTGSGKVTTTDGPLGLFGVNIPISSGQSGSPIYDTDGRVLGLMVGSLEGEGIDGQHYYRPLSLIWDIAFVYSDSDNCRPSGFEEIQRIVRRYNEWCSSPLIFTGALAENRTTRTKLACSSTEWCTLKNYGLTKRQIETVILETSFNPSIVRLEEIRDNHTTMPLCVGRTPEYPDVPVCIYSEIYLPKTDSYRMNITSWGIKHINRRCASIFGELLNFD